jgi:hypothetical protein
MKLSHAETKFLIELALTTPAYKARDAVRAALLINEQNEAQFYEGVAFYCESLKLTSQQWFDFLSIFRNRVLRSELSLNKILSEEQLKRLPPVTG